VPFVAPQLASPLPSGFRPEAVPGCWWRPGSWHAEEKYDGHRVCLGVAEDGRDLFGNPTVRAWSRNGIEHILPRHVREVLESFPSGVYDGELLVPGERSYGTQRLENAGRLVLVLFDVVELLGHDTTGHVYTDRRAYLSEVFRSIAPPEAVRLAWSRPIETVEQLRDLTLEVWSRDGEGLILKNADGAYLPGKRARHWLKIKQLSTAVLTVVGYQQGKMGPHSVLVLRDPEGNETTVKWRTLVDLDRLNRDPHAFIGRKLRIEFQERTPDGGYRHPRWDRWEDE